MPALFWVRKLFLQISAAGECDAPHIQGPAVLEKALQKQVFLGALQLSFHSFHLCFSSKQGHCFCLSSHAHKVLWGQETWSVRSSTWLLGGRLGPVFFFRPRHFFCLLLPSNYQKGRQKYLSLSPALCTSLLPDFILYYFVHTSLTHKSFPYSNHILHFISPKVKLGWFFEGFHNVVGSSLFILLYDLFSYYFVCMDTWVQCPRKPEEGM